MYLKKIRTNIKCFRSDQSSVWEEEEEEEEEEEATTHSYAWEINYQMT